MAFPFKDNTNTGGEPLCDACMFDHLVHRDAVYHCDRDMALHNDVGICNKYQERKIDNG